MALSRALTFAALIFTLDRVLKLWVVEVMDLKTRFYIEVLDPYLNLTMAWNRGVNFGLFDMGHSGRWILIALAVAISGALLWWVRRAPGWAAPLAVGAIVGGALGNAWDRIQYGAVADFINMSCCNIINPFAFNVADIAIFAGAFALILFSPERDARPRPRRRAPPKPRKKA
jgi:signal peptidase II